MIEPSLEGPRHGMTEDEVAAQLSREEGHPVSVNEVRRITGRALRKLRTMLEIERGLRLGDLLPDEWRL
ncbi:hypothetical protein CCAE64S_02448 [Castellaniella caeni]